MRIYLIRHGETDWNATERAQGRIDIPLNERGMMQAKRVATHLASNGTRFSALYASPLQRAYGTAEAIADATQLTAVPDERLVEVGVGAIEGLTSQEVRAKFPEIDAQLRTSKQRVHWPGQEAREDFIARVRDFHTDLRARHRDGENIIIVSHGATIGVYVMMLLGLDLHQRSPFIFDNASLTLVHLREPVHRLIRLNDTCHLQ